MPNPTPGACEFCGRAVALTFRRLSPRPNHRKNWFRTKFSVDDLRSRGAWLCRLWQNAVHEPFDESTLGLRLNTIEALRAEPPIQRHVEWASRQRHHRAW